MQPLKGKQALVTGVGRRKGIGFAVCEALAKNGADVFFTYWHTYDSSLGFEGSQEDPMSFKEHFEQFGTHIACTEVDLSQEESPKELFLRAVHTFGHPHILINNACYSTHQNLASLDVLELDAHYKINVRATTLLCKYFYEAFDALEGHIVNLTSGQSLGVMEDELPYTITKAAVDMLTLQLAPEFLKKGITINAFDPGPTDTGWMDESLKETIGSTTPSHTLLTPKDASESILSFIIGEQKDVTGTIVHEKR